MKVRLPSESVIMKDTATARNTGWCSEGAGKKHGQLSLLLPSNFLPMPAGQETRVMQSAEVWLLGHRVGPRRTENGTGSIGYPGRLTST